MSEPRLPTAQEQQQLPVIQAMMNGLIDYAGLFPPSKLPLAEAIQEYAAYRQSRDRWMLSRFIIPDTLLAKLDEHAELFKDKPPFRFSVTVGTGETYDRFLEMLIESLERIRDFEDLYGQLVQVEMLEARLPVSASESHNPETLRLFFESIQRTLSSTLGHSLQVFIEAPWNVQFNDAFKSTHDDLFDHVATAIQWHNDARDESGYPFGFKLRCGGVNPDDVPSPEIVASALSPVIRTGVPFKATAGLHHPIRHYRDEFGGHMHGFLNVFGAGALGKKHHLSQAQLAEIIADESPDHFTCSDDSFAWNELTVSLQELQASRSDQFISYGSCSFDEPREDLVDLNLLK